jgi:methylated-DNA-[protein]-cysteine S-methyltransferase
MVYKKNINSTPYGPLDVFWKEVNEKPKIIRVLLSKQGSSRSSLFQRVYPSMQELSCDFIDDIANRIVAFLEGEDICFSLESVDLSRCSQFQRNVLYTEHRIPRGGVSSYRLIAEYLGIKTGARAVGNALATNPVPLIVPCHRAIRSDLHLGGYQGGVEMKQALLENEGIDFDYEGRVICNSLYYS